LLSTAIEFPSQRPPPTEPMGTIDVGVTSAPCISRRLSSSDAELRYEASYLVREMDEKKRQEASKDGKRKEKVDEIFQCSVPKKVSERKFISSFFCFDSTLFFFGLTTTMASSEEQWHLRAPVASNPVVFFGE